MSEPLSTTFTASSKLEYDFGVVSEAMVTSPKSNGAPILSIVNVIGTRGVRLAVPGDVQPAHQAAEGRARVVLGIGEGVTNGAKVLGERGRRVETGSQRHGVDAVGDEAGFSSWGCPANGMPTDEVRLAGQAIDEHLERREQRGEERGPDFRPGLLDRGVQLFVDPQVLAAAAVGLRGGAGSGEGQVEDRGSVGILRGPVLLVGRRRRRHRSGSSARRRTRR